MRAKQSVITFCLCLLVAPAILQAQSVPSSVVRCTSGCGSSGSSNSSSRSSSSRSSAPVLSAAEQEQERRHNAAHYLNEQGIAASYRKDWMAALHAFQQAHELNPDGVTIQQNLAGAQNDLGVEAENRGDWKTAINYYRDAVTNDSEESVYAENLKNAESKYQAAEAKKERQRQAAEWEKKRQAEDAATAQQMRGTIGQLSSTVASSPAVSTPGLDFEDPSAAEEKPSLKSDRLRDAPNDPKRPKSSPRPGRGVTAGGDTKAGDQLKSALEFGTVPPGRTDDARRNTFDNHGGANGSLDAMVVDGRGGGRRDSQPVPATVANSPRYKALQGQKAKLETKSKELDAKLAEIRHQQETGQGDASALKMEAAKIKGELAPLRSQIQTVQIKMDDLSVAFAEEKPTVKAPGASKPPPPPPK